MYNNEFIILFFCIGHSLNFYLWYKSMRFLLYYCTWLGIHVIVPFYFHITLSNVKLLLNLKKIGYYFHITYDIVKTKMIFKKKLIFGFLLSVHQVGNTCNIRTVEAEVQTDDVTDRQNDNPVDIQVVNEATCDFSFSDSDEHDDIDNRERRLKSTLLQLKIAKNLQEALIQMMNFIKSINVDINELLKKKFYSFLHWSFFYLLLIPLINFIFIFINYSRVTYKDKIHF